MKFVLSTIAAGLASSVISAHAQDPAPFKATLLGQVVLPTGLKIAGTEFGGISGLDFDAASGLFYAISDDRSERAPARLYTLKLAIDGKGVHGVDIVSSAELRNAEGAAFAKKDIDPESIRFDSAANRIFWSSEGDAAGRPAIYEAKPDGSHVRSFAIPEAYLPNADKTRGVRGNLSFESLDISPDGKTLWAGTENALAQDGDKATLEAGSPSRVIGFDIASGTVAAEHVYDNGPIFTKATQDPYYNDNGLSEFLLFGPDELLTIERAFALGIGSEINFYLASFSGATDVKDVASIKDVTAKPMSKRKVLKIGEGDFGLDIDNIESVTWGPEIDGRRTLVIASDNNFNPEQFTQFVVLKLDAATN
ncbi:esterase-like activity of phytase family protein [Aminobacter carboxidus]|uniref:Esterase-like activity of phytase family protein n=1 Tax=Aminobacter carboxidus TaxID=376165 RepID=A0ABR9GJR4_9HYPH|nr:esterase-like activity of phytase family protein [Aminobacter carboxidus]MBE1203927.1 esterase-like activity of phytase family protein [Aminobacter carboxidus]